MQQQLEKESGHEQTCCMWSLFKANFEENPLDIEKDELDFEEEEASFESARQEREVNGFQMESQGILLIETKQEKEKINSDVRKKHQRFQIGVEIPNQSKDFVTCKAPVFLIKVSDDSGTFIRFHMNKKITTHFNENFLHREKTGEEGIEVISEKNDQLLNFLTICPTEMKMWGQSEWFKSILAKDMKQALKNGFNINENGLKWSLCVATCNQQYNATSDSDTYECHVSNTHMFELTETKLRTDQEAWVAHPFSPIKDGFKKIPRQYLRHETSLKKYSQRNLMVLQAHGYALFGFRMMPKRAKEAAILFKDSMDQDAYEYLRKQMEERFNIKIEENSSYSLRKLQQVILQMSNPMAEITMTKILYGKGTLKYLGMTCHQSLWSAYTEMTYYKDKSSAMIHVEDKKVE